MSRRPTRPRPWWFHLIRNAVPVAWLVLAVLVVVMVVRFVVWWLLGVRLWF